ncbi:gibberellin 2-beta-dioxygenase 8-like [Trifolium pratense]|uniref:gibberellin 2-beta-dioxygenase 8-like n=1 Tax=Trifolium pratense TaxID=57577 RepID=UPI001E69282D|nr:gibberellin 2-beta-dioxygenase 8-like [Trifolium pratense]
MDPISDPPFEEAYKNLLNKTQNNSNDFHNGIEKFAVVEERELPMIDLSRLENEDEMVREECKFEIAKASQEWGFFQVINHGIPKDIFNKLKSEQEKVFKLPFDKKTKEDKFLQFSSGSYRWGTPSATCVGQLSWSEAFHILLKDVLGSSTQSNTLRSSIEEFATISSNLAQTLADILAEKMGHDSTFFKDNCLPNTCYLRLNRYPPCPIASPIHGLMPHTDSDFITILYQDQVGGLQLVKDKKWIAVKPNPNALIINIGDLFQAWSNGVYKSIEHRVVTNPKIERFSMAYFLCPSNDTVIESCKKPSLYKKFSFQEYRQQVRDDVQSLGSKIGLPRFLLF